MEQTLLSGLNEQQTQAVLHDSGALLVIAGPGSGKTTVLTRRIAYLLNGSKNDKYKILALTFTNKAANEMKERIEKYVGSQIKRLFIGTFHSFCSDVLRKYGNYIGIQTDFTLYEDNKDYLQLLMESVQEELDNKNSPSRSVLSKFLDESVLRNSAPNYLSTIMRLKNRLIGPEDLSKLPNRFDEAFCPTYSSYNNKLRQSNVVDFADLLLLTYKLFNDKPFVAKQYRNIYRYLLIDEAQDTNKAQFELIQAFCGEDHRNVFIVADEDQLIYEWNDARFEYLQQFVQNQKATLLQMFENYRCPSEVLEAANRLIRLNLNRLPSKRDLKANSIVHGSAILLNEYELPDTEAQEVIRQILTLDDYTNTCIIARNKFVLDRFATELSNFSIPYQMASTDTRFQSREANLIMDILHATFNEDDKIHIRAICDYYSINLEDAYLTTNPNTLFVRVLHLLDIVDPELSQLVRKLLNSKNRFAFYIKKLFEILRSGEESNESSLLVDDRRHLEEILDRYEKEREEEDERSLGDFLSYLALSPKGKQRTDGVTLLTGHAAKGLEFDYVFLVSLNQGIFPDYRAEKEPRQLEEERRNCFVAVTRTKKKLFISYTTYKRTRYSMIQHKPSQFITEMNIVK